MILRVLLVRVGLYFENRSSVFLSAWQISGLYIWLEPKTQIFAFLLCVAIFEVLHNNFLGREMTVVKKKLKNIYNAGI